MSTSGQTIVRATDYDDLKFSWWRTNYSIEDNYTDIAWSLDLLSYTYGAIYSIPERDWNVNVNGNSYSGTASVAIGNNTTKNLASGTTRIYHNTDGTKYFEYSFSQVFNIQFNGYVGTISGAGNATLDTIPRYANFTNFAVSKRDETSVSVAWSADAVCDSVQYRINDGTWADLPSDGVISNLEANTDYKFALRIKRTDSQLWTISNDVWCKTYDYPKPTNINNFTIGEGATVYLDNPLNRNVTLELISINDSSVIGTYTGTNNGNINNEFKTTSAINAQYASIPNTNTGTYYAKVTYGNIIKTSEYANYYTNISECTPEFSDFSYMDNNSSVVAVTGNNQIFIKGLSVIKAIISSANKMTTKKYATPQNYALSCDTLNATVNYSENDINVELGVINSAGTKRLNVRAYDSRTNNVSVYKDITVYDYSTPVINAEINRLNNFENQTTLKVSGSYTKLTIDNVDKNIVTNVQYRYREKDGTWSNWTNINFTASNGEFTCTDTILSLDNSKSFEFEIKVIDNLTYSIDSGTVDIGQAIFFISTNNKTCYINNKEIVTNEYVGNVSITGSIILNNQEILEYDIVDSW